MNMYPQYKSKSGYYINNDGIDSYGVNHKNFTTRDELEYQFARVEREKLLNELKNYGKNIINEVSPYIPTYPLGYGVGVVKNTCDKLKNMYDVYKKDGVVEAVQQYGEPSVKEAMKMSDLLTPILIPDVNKHQYVSCIGANGGILAAAEILAGGIYKEYNDYNKKVKNPQDIVAYNGRIGIFKDGVKDMGNNIKGAWTGIWANSPQECEKLLPESFRNKIYP